MILFFLTNWSLETKSNEVDKGLLLYDSKYGNYLSWSHARNSSNPEDSKSFLLALKNSLENHEIIEKAFFSSLLINEWELSIYYAGKIVSFDDSNFFANIVLSTNEIINGEFESSESYLKSISTTPIDENFLKVILSWHKYSQGKKEPYIDLFSNPESEECIPLNCLHIALISSLMGKDNTAKKNFDFLKNQDLKSFRLLELLFNFYIGSNDYQSAKFIHKVLEDNNLEIENYNLTFNERKNFNPIKNSTDGVAEAYANIAGWFYEQGLYKFSAYFSVIGLQIRPELSSLKYLLSNIYLKLKLDNMVLSSVKNIKLGDLYYTKTLGIKLKSLSNLGRNETIIRNLKNLVSNFPNRDDYKLYLADTLRSSGFHRESINYYDNLIKEITDPKKEDWGIFYSRGISHERLKNWKLSEKDLLKAIELKPDAAYVLNYLGYSWLERKINLKKALKLISEANELEPNDAFISDSLGWAYFLLGEYEKSITILEQAILILPFDSTLNDHLGDAYWKVGRKLEAYSQWKKVLVYDPDFEYKSRVVHKITFGL